MSLNQIARLGDSGSHGGSISTASTVVYADGIGIARDQDTYSCAIHGDNPLISGSNGVYVDGRLVIRVGDSASCGAVINSGSEVVYSY